MKKWNSPEVSNLTIKKTKSEGLCVCDECFPTTFKDHGDNGNQQGHIPGACPHTCPICKGCKKPGNSSQHTQCLPCACVHS